MPATKVIVNIPGEEAYDVRIGGGVLANLGAHLRKLPVFAAVSYTHLTLPTIA